MIKLGYLITKRDTFLPIRTPPRANLVVSLFLILYDIVKLPILNDKSIKNQEFGIFCSVLGLLTVWSASGEGED